jgi:hypothetical protein
MIAGHGRPAGVKEAQGPPGKVSWIRLGFEKPAAEWWLAVYVALIVVSAPARGVRERTQ